MNKSQENWELSLLHASEAARILFPEKFFWELVDDTSPFGSDYGADTLFGFVKWRQVNPGKRVLDFVENEIELYGFDVEFIGAHSEFEVSELIRNYKLDPFAQDWIVIAAALGQFILEEKVDTDLLEQAIISTDRQKMKIILDYWVVPARNERWEKLEVISGKFSQMEASF